MNIFVLTTYKIYKKEFSKICSTQMPNLFMYKKKSNSTNENEEFHEGTMIHKFLQKLKKKLKTADFDSDLGEIRAKLPMLLEWKYFWSTIFSPSLLLVWLVELLSKVTNY